MNEPWIKAYGEANENEIYDIVNAWSACHPGCTSLLFFTDCYRPCPLSQDDDIAHLLEARVFSDDGEIWLHRSALGLPFVWREADDRTLEENISQYSGPLPKEPSKYMIAQVQKLDIDLTRDAGIETPAGCRAVYSTGGRVYLLPDGDENAVRVIAYFDYDENGVGTVKDWRYSGFCYEEQFGRRNKA